MKLTENFKSDIKLSIGIFSIIIFTICIAISIGGIIMINEIKVFDFTNILLLFTIGTLVLIGIYTIVEAFDKAKLFKKYAFDLENNTF